jgi:hypothetical protein
MVTTVVRGLVAAVLLAAAGTGAAPTRALAAEPEVPPATFVPAPPDHQPGSSQPVYGSTPEPAQSAADDELPGFITLDRTGMTAHAGIQVGFTKLDEASLTDDGFFMRFNPYGQVMFPNRQVGVYGQMPLSHGFNLNGADTTGWGNLELGAVYLPLSDSRLILRGGLALPTGSGIEDFDSVATNTITTFERLTDFVLAAPEYTTLRLSASTIRTMDMFFVRADGGFDLVFSRPSAFEGSTSAFFRANVAGGIRTTAVDFTLELANLAFLNGDDVDERFLHTAAIGARTRGENQLYLGAVFPLDEEIRGEVWILSLGYMRPFI